MENISSLRLAGLLLAGIGFVGSSAARAQSVGIGTLSPAAALHLYSASNPTVFRLQSSGAPGSVGLDFYSDPQGSATEWRPSFMRSTDAGSFTGGLAFYTNGTGFANKTGSLEGMRLVNGRLGIGTATPTSRLTVEADNSTGGGDDDVVLRAYGATAAPGFSIQRARGTAAVPAQVQTGDFVGVMGFGPRVAAGQNFTLSGMQSYYRGDGTTALSDLELFTSGSVRMYINENGRVGVANTTPAAQLDILGGADSNGANDPQAQAWQWRGGGYRHWLRTRHNAGLNAGGNALDFFVNASGTAAGSSAPTVGTQHVLTLDTYGTNGGARAGFGTQNPASSLHVYSDANPVVLRLQSTGGFGAAGLDFYSDPQGSANEWRPSFMRSIDAGGFTGGLAFYTNGTGAANKTASLEGMRLVNGKLGVGVPDPVSRLANTNTNIIGSDGIGINPPSLTWINDVQGYAGAFYNTANTAGGYNGLAVKVANGGASTAALDVSQGTSQTTAGASLLRVRGDGNVGIGTAAPATKLEVSGTVTVSGGNTSEVNRTQTSAANLVPICYGNLNIAGTINVGSTPNFTVSHTVTGIYDITIASEAYFFTDYNTTATLTSSTPGFINVTSINGTTLRVFTFGTNAAAADRPFNFVVYKP